MAVSKRSNNKVKRNDAGTARAILERLLPAADARRPVLSFLADSITAAQAVSDASWSVTLTPDRVRLNVGPGAALTIDRDGIHLAVARDALSAPVLRDLKRRGYLAADSGYRALPAALQIHIPTPQAANLLTKIAAAHAQLVAQAAQERKQTTWYEAHSTGVVEYLRAELHREVPDPSYVTALRSLAQSQPVAPFDVCGTVQRWLVAHGLHFTPWQIATFFTALQVKGLVILSGISGTGKTRLAQSFAAMLAQTGAQGGHSDGPLAVTVEPTMLRYGRVPLPASAMRFIGSAQAAGAVVVSFDGRNQRCRLVPTATDATGPLLVLTGTARQWLQRHLAPGDTLLLEPELDADQDLINFRLFARAASARSATRPAASTCNSLFLPVRPDWRDSKSLLGYYNPLTATYEWTPLLRFLLRVVDSYRAGDGQAWFVILDEMNLARVEYYFADLLSVLESGRDERGWTSEAILLPYPAEATGDLPPQELYLPPNLYFVGTVNVDETTHTFSPKVLDRAFTLEFGAADFHNYPVAAPKADFAPGPDERRDLLAAFTNRGTFAIINKGVIADTIASHPELRSYLQSLNDALHPHQFHFGYRVFDEIVAFLAAAGDNRAFTAISDSEPATAALDAAVLMKILPRFHGSNAKLEAPLLALLAWCLNPAAPNITTIAGTIDRVESGDLRIQRLRELSYRCPHTAAHALRMLSSLYADGFAVFGG